jgi:hypothetical protein
MKRFLVLALLAAFVLGAGVANAATTLKTSGEMTFNYGWWDNMNFFDTDADKANEDDLMASQRFRAYFDWSASEALRGVFGVEFGTAIWGNAATGADLDGDERAIEVKHAYMDFTVPNTGIMVRMGLQPIALPGNFGSPVLDADAPGILAQYKFNDMVSAAFGWFRLYNKNAGDANAISNIKGAKNDEVDAFALLLPIKGDGFTFTPWAALALHGANATDAGTGTGLSAGLRPTNASAPIGDDLEVWWAGGSFKLDMFAPFVIMADVIYGNQDGSNNSRNDREGWFFDVAVDYKMDMVTPEIFYMYSTGEDDDLANGSERMPTVGNETRGALTPGVGNSFAGNLSFTSFGFGGSQANLSDYDAVLDGSGCSGIWALGLKLKDFSFLPGLKHTLTVAYGQGTNDSDGVKNKGIQSGLTDEDSFWEVDFDHTYSIYENLTAYIEMGYVNVDLDKDVWNAHNAPGNPFTNTKINADDVTAAWKLALCLKYKF